MKNLLTVLFASTITISLAQPKTPEQISLSLKLNSTGGTNGCSVAWNPINKMYYAIIAGNIDYPIDIFDETGKWISKQVSGVDVRGIWFNPKTKKLEGKSNEGELFSWSIDSDGGLDEPQLVKESIGIDGQFVVSFSKGFYFYHEEGVIKKVSAKGAIDYIQLARPSEEDDYNTYGMGYTEVKNYEIVLFNRATSSLEFYNLKGDLTATVALPGYIPDMVRFRFSFANNMAWLFDTDERVWNGYKVF